MNKNTAFYGIVILGGILGYYAWKNHSMIEKEEAQGLTSIKKIHSDTNTFVDDAPVNPNILGIPSVKKTTPFVETVKKSLSKITEPFTSNKNKIEITGLGQFADS